MKSELEETKELSATNEGALRATASFRIRELEGRLEELTRQLETDAQRHNEDLAGVRRTAAAAAQKMEQEMAAGTTALEEAQAETVAEATAAATREAESIACMPAIQRSV